MRRLVPLAIGLLCLTACLGQREADAHEAVRRAAEEYYACLVDGDVDGYLKGIRDYEAMSEEYRSQLRDMFAQYLHQEQTLRGGLAAARALRDTLIDSTLAQVFLEVEFGDSTREQVSLPLVLTEKGWRMK